LFPEYYVLRVDEFDKKAVTPLDEWIAFFKTGEIPNNAKAKGEKEKALSIAGKLLQTGMSVENIVDLTGLLRNDIEMLNPAK
jgi:hypothetical protein